MLSIKVQCACGQRFAFDVEPLNGRMPSAVACPVCGADGTAAANQIIAQKLAAQPAMAMAAAPVAVAAPALAVPTARVPAPTLTPTARVAAPALAVPAATAAAAPDDGPLLKAPLPNRATSRLRESEGEKWKWWYFVLAGICIGGYSIWQAYDQHRAKPLGELFLAVFCIAIGIWDFQNKRKKRMRG